MKKKYSKKIKGIWLFHAIYQANILNIWPSIISYNHLILLIKRFDSSSSSSYFQGGHILFLHSHYTACIRIAYTSENDRVDLWIIGRSV